MARASAQLSGARVTSDFLSAGEVVVLVSIDTEEDNWVPTRDRITTENVLQLPRLNAMLERLGARPTYFVAHSVAANERSSALISELGSSDFVEIGAHLHPWNTPPLTESLVPRHTMLLNLPVALQRAKLQCLTTRLQECLGGRRPTAFRAGRWALGTDTIGVLLEGGYTVDSSVTPYTNWSSYDGANRVGAPVNAYRLDEGADPRCPVLDGRLLEIPASFGFNRAPLDLWGRLYRTLSSRAGHALLLDRVAAVTGLLRHVSLSPETDLMAEMIDLTGALLASGARHLHLYLHSPSLCPGLTPFVRTSSDLARFYSGLEEYLERIAALVNVRFATVSEAALLLDPSRAGVDREAVVRPVGAR